MNNELLDAVRNANREFQQFIEQVAQVGAQVVVAHGAARQLEKVNLRLQEVAQHLAAVRKPPNRKPHLNSPSTERP